MKQLVWLLLVIVPPVAAEVRLPHVLSDHAVLQRNAPLHVWGWAAPREKISARFHGSNVTTEADQLGNWELWFPAESAGGPYVLTVAGDATATPVSVDDLLVGDVWFASGQSNMEMPMTGFPGASVLHGKEEITKADEPSIRLLAQKRVTSMFPKSDSEEVWQMCSPESVASFSAVAYLFAKQLHQQLKVPIGIISSSWGGTPVQSWISNEGIAWSNLQSVYLQAGILARQQGETEATWANFAAQDAALRRAGKDVPVHAAFRGDHSASRYPAALYNGMVSPYVRYGIRGVIWYQGETDHEGYLARNYSRTFPALITDWRNRWNQGDFPFLFVQIASYGDPGAGWGEVRDAQRRTLALRNTGMVSALDLGEPGNIHPANKPAVASRLAAQAKALTYSGKPVSGALFVRATPENESIRCWFDQAHSLRLLPSDATGFEVAGDDLQFFPASIRLEQQGDSMTVVAQSQKVSRPKFVRYGWQSLVTSFLYNEDDLPMSTFTSESDAASLGR